MKPTAAPTIKPTIVPTIKPTAVPTAAPTSRPTGTPIVDPIDKTTEEIAEEYEQKNLAAAIITVGAQTYTGKALKPAITVELDGVTLTRNTDYTVLYKNNKKIGTATIVITGKGEYTGTAETIFKINPKKVKGLKLKASAKKLTVTWKKTNGVTGYQIQYGTRGDFKKAKTIAIKKAATVKSTLKSLKAKKTYYVRIRSYKIVKGKKYYSIWSDAVKAKTK